MSRECWKTLGRRPQNADLKLGAETTIIKVCVAMWCLQISAIVPVSILKQALENKAAKKRQNVKATMSWRD
jgi:hypothetical protein